MPGGPFLANKYPDSYGVSPNVSVSVNLLPLSGYINTNTIDAYVDGSLAFSGPSTFIVPYNGPSSSLAPISIDSYDGYHLVLDRATDFDIGTYHTVRITCQDSYGTSLDQSWPFSIHNMVESLDQGPYEITFDVTFSVPMNEDSDLTGPANYVFNDGAYTRKIDILSPTMVRLWTELVYGENTYTVTVSNVTDSYGATIPSGYNTASVSPFISDASLANTNGMVRTWRESQLVHADLYRAYLAGNKGIDVFRKINTAVYDRWAQVFDEYGISSMFVANFPGALSITDTSAPYLINVVPAQGEYAPVDTTIQFTIVDDTSAIEITDLIIYVNGNIIFMGNYGGWQNNYDGTIDVGYQTLDVVLYPPSDFVFGSLIVVRVIASDLLGNRMDTEYSFSISSVLTAGFGLSEFGLSSFGGI